MLLTFAIPVFNDSEGLRLTLSSVLSSNDLGQNAIEIIVSDNHSEDDSFQVAEKLLAGTPDTVVVRQDLNLGFAGNLKALTNLAKGRYVWFLAAGDLLIPGQLKYLAAALHQTNPDFGVVNGMFEYHQTWRSLPTSHSYSSSNSQSFSKTVLYSHAVSLNIISRKVLEHYWGARSSGNSPFGLGKESVTPHDSQQPVSSNREVHWPHLEAVCQTILDDVTGSITWMEYEGLSVLLGKNKNGDWDKRPSALEVFRQWAEIVSLTHRALPKSQWLSELNTKLHGFHLLQFLFMIRKDETIGGMSTLRQALSMPIGPGIKIAAATVALLPKGLVNLIVYGRKFWLSIRNLSFAKTRYSKKI